MSSETEGLTRVVVVDHVVYDMLGFLISNFYSMARAHMGTINDRANHRDNTKEPTHILTCYVLCCSLMT